MKSPYIAKGPHKEPCSYCGTPILPGDKVTAWCWVAEDPPPMGGIVRVHFTCGKIGEEICIEYHTAGKAFEYYDDASGSENPTEIQARAAAFLADSRRKP